MTPIAHSPVGILREPPTPTPVPAPVQLETAIVRAPEGHSYQVNTKPFTNPYPNARVGGTGVETITVASSEGKARAELMVRAGGLGDAGQAWSEEVQIFLPDAFTDRMEYKGSVRSMPDGSLHLADERGHGIPGNALNGFELTEVQPGADGKTTQATLKLRSGDHFTLHNGRDQALRVVADNNQKGVTDAGDLAVTGDGKNGKALLDAFTPSAMSDPNALPVPAHINAGLGTVALSPSQAILSALQKDRASPLPKQLYEEMLATPPAGYSKEQIKSEVDWQLLRSKDFFGDGTSPVLKAMGFEEAEKLEAAMRGDLKYPYSGTIPGGHGTYTGAMGYGDLQAAMDLYRFGTRQDLNASSVPNGFVNWMNQVTTGGKADLVLRAAEHVYEDQRGILKEEDRNNSKDWFEGQPDNPGEFLQHLNEHEVPKMA